MQNGSLTIGYANSPGQAVGNCSAGRGNLDSLTISLTEPTQDATASCDQVQIDGLSLLKLIETH